MVDEVQNIRKNWEEIKIGDLCKLINGRAFKPTEWTETGLPIIRIQNLNDETKPFNYFNGSVDEKHKITNGDVLISWSGTPGTSFGAHFWNRGDGVLNQHIFKVQVNPIKCLKQFFVYAINWRLDELICRSQGGVGLRHITKGNLENITIPIPYLDIQRRIVARIESLSGEIKRNRLLLEQMRLDNDLLLPNALNEVVERLEYHYQLESLQQYIVHLTSGSRDWSKYANINNEGSLFIKVENTQFAKLDLTNIEKLNLPSNITEKRAKVQPNDVLVTITGTIGRCCVVPDNIGDAYVNQHTALIRLKEKLDPYYLMWFILTPLGGEKQTKMMQYGQVKPGLNLTNIRNLRLPVPDISIQKQIVSHIDAIQQEVNKINTIIEEDEQNFNYLEQAILEKAFRGEL